MNLPTGQTAHFNKTATRALFFISMLLLPAANTWAATQLGEVNVTANRTARTVDDSLAAVTVITRQDIEKSQAKSLVQLLSGQPGIITRSTGGLGKTSSLIVRGTSSSHLQVLIDGVRIGSATLGTAPFQDIPLSQIERLEIVRGPRSQLYGADAIGGVLQIFTRDGSEGTQFDGELGYGSYSTLKASAGISGGAKSTTYSLRFSRLESEGFSALKSNNADNDGYENSSIAGRISHRFQNDAKISLNAMRREGNNDYDSAWGPAKLYDTDFVQQEIGTKLELAFNEWWDASFSLGYSLDKNTNNTNGARASFFDTRRKQASWQNDFSIGDESVLTLGADFLRAEVEGSSVYSISERDNKGLFVQYQTVLSNNDLAIGVRHDEGDSFGQSNTYNLAWGRRLNNAIRLMASYGTAYRVPTFNDLYYQDPWGSNGNPNLQPEESSSIEFGVSGEHQWGDWSARVFRTKIDGLIQWVDIGGFVYQPQNVNKARIDGLELSVSTQLMGWDVSANATLMNPKDTNTGLLLVKRSKQSLLVDANRRFGKNELGVRWQVMSETFSDSANTKRSAGYGVVDLNAAHHLDQHWIIRGQISNLLDHKYEEIPTYNTGGRELFISVSYQAK